MATILKVREAELRAVLIAIGYDAGDKAKWDLKRLNKKVSTNDAFCALIDSAKKAAELGDKDLISNILDALREGEDVEVVEDISTQEVSEEVFAELPGAEPGKVSGKKPGEKSSMPAAVAERKKNGKTNGKVEANGRGPSLINAAISVMKQRKKPMKVKDIYEAVVEKGLWADKKGKTPWATLGAAIYTEVKKKGDESRFVQVGKGEFTLR